MAMRVGEMMVIIRAQDFASRTLRRVGNEFAHMSREQMIAAKQAALTADKMNALQKVKTAEGNMRNLRLLQTEMHLRERHAQALERQAKAQSSLRRLQGLASQAGTAQALQDRTRAVKAHAASLRELDRATQALQPDQVTGKNRKAFERLARAQANAGTGGKKAARELKAAGRAVESLGRSAQESTRAWKRWWTAVDRATKSGRRLAEASQTLKQAQATTPLTTTPRIVGRAQAMLPGAQKELSQARMAVQGLQGQLTRVGEIVSAMPRKFQSLSRALNMTSGAQATLNEHMDTASTRLRAAHAALDDNTRKQMAFNEALRRMPLNQLGDMAHAMSGVGRTMQLFGAVSTVALGAAANAAANFNTQVSLAATQARDLTAPVSQVSKRIDQLTNGFNDAGTPVKGILDLMMQFPATQEEMAASAYDVFSSMDLMTNGVTDVAKGLGLLKTANEIAVAGGEDLETATNAMITVFNNFNPKLDQTSETLDTMFDIIRFGRMRLGDFNTMMNKVAPAAAGAGLKLRDVGGAMAFLTEVMPSQRMVATGISRLVEALNHPDMVKGLKMLEINVRKPEGGLRPLDDIMKDIAEMIPLLTTGQLSAAEFFKTVSALGRGGGQGVMFTAEGRKSFTQMITHMDQYLARQKQIDENKGEFAATRAAQLKALGVQWDIFLNRLRAIVIAIGTDAIPAFQELGRSLQKLLDWWQKLDPDIRKTIVRMAVFASAATLVSGAVLALMGAFIGIEVALRRLMMSAGGASGALGGVLMLLRRFAALAAITIIINVVRKGDASAWDILGAVMTGAMIGSAFGPIGAAVGAIAMTIPIAVIEQKNQDKNWANRWADQVIKDAENQFPMRKKFAAYFAKALREGWKDAMSFEEFSAFEKKFVGPDRTVGRGEDNRAALQLDQTTEATKKAKAAWAAYQKALMKWFEDMKLYNSAMKQWNEDMKRHKEAVKEWGEQLAKATVQAKNDIIDASRDMFMELQKINEQMMGEVFQGPLLGGESGDLMREWGVFGNIKVMIEDAKQANALFKQIQSGLGKLRKKGLTDEAIKAIQAMEPKDALGYIKGILVGSPADQAALIAELNKRNANIKSQTKMDFVDEIQRFKEAGVKMGEAIKDGFEQAKVGAWFDQWIQNKFPSVINQAVNEAVAIWKAENPPPVAPVQPVKPVRPTNPREAARQVAGVSQQNSNNVTTTYITVNMGDSGDTARSREQERRLGFIIRQSVNGKMIYPVGVGGNKPPRKAGEREGRGN